jgi:hypothetical protein
MDMTWQEMCCGGPALYTMIISEYNTYIYMYEMDGVREVLTFMSFMFCSLSFHILLHVYSNIDVSCGMWYAETQISCKIIYN